MGDLSQHIFTTQYFCRFKNKCETVYEDQCRTVYQTKVEKKCKEILFSQQKSVTSYFLAGTK